MLINMVLPGAVEPPVDENTLLLLHDVGNNPVGYSSDRPWGIGGWADNMMTTGYPYVGYLDEFRVSNVARWTENFTPPTKPYNPGSPSSGGESEPFAFTYSGNYTDNRVDGVGTVRLNTSGTLTVLSGKAMVSAYILAGGGGGAFSNRSDCYVAASGGGGGYQTVEVELAPGAYEIVIGTGGAGNLSSSSQSGTGGNGGDTSAFGYTCTGGTGGYTLSTSKWQTYSTAGIGGLPNGGNGSVKGDTTGLTAYGGLPNGGNASTSTVTAYSGGDGYVELTFI